MQVSDRLTDIAELIVERAMALGWQQITAQFGVPMCDDGPARARRAHLRRRLRQARRHGARLLLGPGPGVPARLARRAPGDRRRASRSTTRCSSCAWRSASCTCSPCTRAAGRLYEVDVRLRPSGKGGLLVTNIAAFAEYQRQEAWTWEHQALLHARAVAGCARAARATSRRCAWTCCRNHVRRETLRDGGARHARAHAQGAVASGNAAQFDIKQDAGGIADIEFLAQYWALRVGQGLPAGGACSRTPSASSSRWPRPTWCRRRAWTC